MEGVIEDDRDLFGLPSIAHTGQQHSADSDKAWEMKVDRDIHWYGIGPISVLGFSLNCLVVWVWNSKQEYNPIVFLFKALAGLDNAFIVLFNVWWFFPQDSPAERVLQGVTFGVQYMSVNSSLVLTACRWVSLYTPFKARSLLSRSRVSLMAGGVLVYCAALKMTERLVAGFVHSVRVTSVVNVVLAVVLVLVPVLVQAVLAVSMLWMVRRGARPQHRTSGQPPRSSLAWYSDSPGGRRDSVSTQATEARGLTYTVVSISLMSFVAYPAGVVLNAHLLLGPGVTDTGLWKMVLAVISQLHLANSSVNFCFYALFIGRFRRLLFMKFQADHYYTHSATSGLSRQSAVSALDVQQALDGGDSLLARKTSRDPRADPAARSAHSAHSAHSARSDIVQVVVTPPAEVHLTDTAPSSTVNVPGGRETTVN